MAASTYGIGELQGLMSQIYTIDPATGKPPRLIVNPYIYTVTFSALTQGAVQTQTLAIAANLDFLCLGLQYRAQIGAAQTQQSKTAAFCRLLIVDSGTNEQWSNAPVDLENWFSSYSSEDNTLPYPRWCSGRTTLSLQLTNYAPTAETYTTVDLALVGLQVKKM